MEACKRMDPEKFLRPPHPGTNSIPLKEARPPAAIGRVAYLCLAGCLFCNTVLSQEASSPVALSGEQYLQQFLDDAHTLQAEFYQELSDADGQLVEVASGTMSLERPNRFLWQYRDPIEQLVLADGENFWIYDIELEQATVTPLGEAIAATPAMLLSGDQAVRDGFNTVENFAADDLSWVRLAPKTQGSDFRSVVVGFRDGELARLELVDGLEQITRIEFSEVVVNEGLGSGLFDFDPPDGVDVIGERR